MSEEISYREFRDGLADILNRIEYRDESFVVTRRGKAVAALMRYEGIPLTLTESGPGSRASIVDYVRTVIEERTMPNDDTTAERLAESITTSILHRLGATYPEATKR